jgi:site-specific recombinase XerD
MRPSEKKTTTESIELYRQSLEGNNYSAQSIKAYLGDLAQFIKWLQTRRVDWDIPHRIERIDIVQFINHLAEQKASAITRKRKLAAIRGFLKFCKDNQIIYGNPADTIEGPIREERDPSILLKTDEFIPFSFWYDAPLTSQDSDRRHDLWQGYGSPTYSPARWSSWISPA